MLNKKLRSFFLMICALVFATGGSAQTMYLDTLSFYPDSNIIHTGLPVRWSGRVVWWGNLNASYSLVYTFGNGQGYTVSRSTGLSSYGTDTFNAVHAYASSGSYVAKVVLRNALGAGIDSLVRPFNAGSGFAVSGKVYYDCIQNCQMDTGELGMGQNWIGVRVNGRERLYPTDSLGFYCVPLAAGDTLQRGSKAPDPVNAYISSWCANPKIVSATRSSDIPMWLMDRMYMSNLIAPRYACNGGPIVLYVRTNNISGNKPRTKVDYRNGDVTPYSYSSDDGHDFYYSYAKPGDYDVIVDLYNTNYAGPYMRFITPVHVDTCTKMILKPVYDVNSNCTTDSAEAVPGGYGIVIHSKFLGATGAVNDSGTFEYLRYPRDTAVIDSVLRVYGPTYYEAVRLRQSCPGLVITDSSPDTLDVPFIPVVRLSGVTALGTPCYADTIRFMLTGHLLQYPAGSGFRLISDYGDGHADTLAFSYSLDSFTLYPAHRYDTAGTYNCRFVLIAPNGDSDTIGHQMIINNCFPVFLRPFYDRNGNCVKDSGEAFAMDVQVNTTSIWSEFSNRATGLVTVYNTGVADSVTSVIDNPYMFQRGYYSRATTAAAGCMWPLLNVPGAHHLLPLVDAPSVSLSYSPTAPAPCQLSYDARGSVQISGNYGLSYKFVHYSGNGIYADTVAMTAPGLQPFSVPARIFAPGRYQPSYRLLDSFGIVRASGTLPPFTVTDTCGGKGMLFHDVDGDCLFSTGDRPLAGQPVQLISGTNGVITVLTDSGGRFFAPQSHRADSVRTTDTVSGNLALACSSGSTLHLADSTVLAVPYTCAGGSDLRLLAAHHYFRDSTADTLILYPAGHTCNAGPGTLTLSLPAGLRFTGADLPGGVVSGDSVMWNIDTLQKLPELIRVGLYCSPPSGTPVLCLSATLSGAGPGAASGSNDFYLCDSVRNDIPEYYKSLSSDSMLADGALQPGKELIYSLRIRNGSAWDTIHSLMMYDTLDTRLDLNTLHILDASFAHDAQLLSGDVLRITSYGRDSLAPGAEAAIRFGIMPKPGLIPGTRIRNRISVVLGGLPDGESNMVEAMAARPPAPEPELGLRPLKEGELRVYPVPAAPGGSFFIELPATSAAGGRFDLLDVRGAVCLSGSLRGGRTQVAAPDLAPGMYLLRVVTPRTTYLRKMVLEHAAQ